LQGRRSDTYYSVSNWDSDGDSNEPLRKCPKFDDGDSHQNCQFDKSNSVPNVVPSIGAVEDLNNISEEQKQLELVRRSSFPFKGEEEQRYYLSNTIICNHGQLGEQVVPNPSSVLVSQYYHHHEQVLLLNQQQQLELEGQEQEQRECQHGSSVTLDEVDSDMGQSHDSENVFSQSVSVFSTKQKPSHVKYTVIPYSYTKFTHSLNLCDKRSMNT